MIGRTLSRYVAGRFTRAVLGVFGGLFLLVYLLDFVEMLRRGGDVRGASAPLMAWLSLLRVPTVTEQVLPFAVLFGAMVAFITLTRRLELVVARAAGLSVWQFLLPPVVIALLIGALATGAYNPLSAVMKRRADRIEASLFGTALAQPGQGVWLQQNGPDSQAILRADAVLDDHVTLSNVTAFVFDRNGVFRQRIGAPTATLANGNWRFADAHIISPDPDVAPKDEKLFLLPTPLTPSQLNEAVASPDDVPFWSLRTVAARSAAAGLDATPYRLRFQTLLARPVLLVAMVLIAAISSLRFFRFGGVAKMASGGVAAGFALYVVTKLTSDLGAAGILNAGVAAWSPAIAGSMLATLVLLYQEDG